MSTDAVTTDLAARLNFLGVRTDAVRVNPEAFDVDRVLMDFEGAISALEAILALHVSEVIEGRPPVTVCSRCSGRPVWPCTEIKIMSRWMLSE